jgi:hypothetical protein
MGIGWLPPTYQDLLRLPTDPARLGATLTERVRANPQLRGASHARLTAELVGTIGYLLERYPLPPQLRAGLYRVLTRLGGAGVPAGLGGPLPHHPATISPDQGPLACSPALLVLLVGLTCGARSATTCVPSCRSTAGRAGVGCAAASAWSPSRRSTPWPATGSSGRIEDAVPLPASAGCGPAG